jgi:hypothetical protein
VLDQLVNRRRQTLERAQTKLELGANRIAPTTLAAAYHALIGAVVAAVIGDGREVQPLEINKS